MSPCCSLRSLDDKFNLDRVVGPVDSRCHGCRCCWVASFRIRPPQPWSLLAHTHSRRQVHTPSFLLDLSFIQSFVCVTVCVGACGRHTKDAGDEAGPRGRQGTGWEELPLRCPAPHTLALLRDTSTGWFGAMQPCPTPRRGHWASPVCGPAEGTPGAQDRALRLRVRDAAGGARGGGELCVGPEWDGECTPDQDGRPAGSQEGRPGLFPKSTPQQHGLLHLLQGPSPRSPPPGLRPWEAPARGRPLQRRQELAWEASVRADGRGAGRGSGRASWPGPGAHGADPAGNGSQMLVSRVRA